MRLVGFRLGLVSHFLVLPINVYAVQNTLADVPTRMLAATVLPLVSHC